jgi:hypothetical protein
MSYLAKDGFTGALGLKARRVYGASMSSDDIARRQTTYRTRWATAEPRSNTTPAAATHPAAGHSAAGYAGKENNGVDDLARVVTRVHQRCY